MDDLGVGRTILALRVRKGWRQRDLAERAGCSQSLIAQLELGRIDATRLQTVRRVLEALEVRTEIQLRGRVADLERLADAAHADLVAGGVTRLSHLDWLPSLEVTYSEYGERGSYDILAVMPSRRAVLVVEAKTELGSAEAIGRKLDEKARLASRVVRRLHGWEPAAVGRVLLVPEATRMRRTIEATPALRLLFPDDPRRLRAWLRDPVGPLAAGWFLSDSSGRGRKRVIVRRVRVPTAPVSTESQTESPPDSHTTTGAAEGREPGSD